MTKSYNKIMLMVLLLLQALSSYAYVIKGTIVDGQNNPIRKAVVIGRNSANKIKVGVETDPFGQFASVNVKDSTLSIEINKDGYTPVYINVNGTDDEFVDLGVVKLNKQVIELNEVTVTTQSVIQKPDRYILIPSSKEIVHSTDGLSLLNNMQYKMPGLIVNETLQRVQVDGKTPVFKMNGKPSSLSKFLSLKPQDVSRIEYYDSPDVRYDNRQVINVILKPREDGGTVMTNVLTAVTTGFVNANAGMNYHSKKSEWDFNYRTNWRDYDKREINSQAEYIGREEPIKRSQEGMPGKFQYLSNELLLGYTYMHNPATTFMAQLGLALEDQDINDNAIVSQSFKNNRANYTNLKHNNINFKSPNLDLFFRKQIDKRQYIEANLYSRYSSGKYDRDYYDLHDEMARNDTTMTHIANKSWRAGLEFMYSRSFDRFTTNFGLQDYYNGVENKQSENGLTTKVRINQNRLSAYGQISGRIKTLRYSASLNLVYNHSDNDSYIVNAVRLKSNISMNLPLSKYVTVNYLLMYDPSMPSVSQQSSTVQRIDDISVRQGNPDLNPSEYLRNRIFIRYGYKKFTTSLWAAHSRNFNPIYYSYSYIADKSSPYYDKFMSKPINGSHDDLINLELNLSVQDLFDFATIWGKLGWDNHHLDLSTRSYCKKRLYASLNGAVSFGGWMVSANYDIVPRYNLSGNVFNTNERWNSISVNYRYKRWNFSATAINLFTKRGSNYKRITISDVHPETLTQNIKNNANMVLLGVNYTFNFGKRQKKANRMLQNGGIDRGVDINY